jgi:heme/copper-type cytochrome/quinol oxidase subunit 3
LLTSEVYVDELGIRYPHMVRVPREEEEDYDIVDSHWPGLAYYVYTFWRHLLSAIVFFAAVLAIYAAVKKRTGPREEDQTTIHGAHRSTL